MRTRGMPIGRRRSIVRPPVVTALLVIALVPFAARASVRQGASGCTPVKGFAHLCRPGLLPAGTYVTRNFMPGLRVTVPAGGWRGIRSVNLHNFLDRYSYFCIIVMYE